MYTHAGSHTSPPATSQLHLSRIVTEIIQLIVTDATQFIPPNVLKLSRKCLRPCVEAVAQAFSAHQRKIYRTVGR